MARLRVGLLPVFNESVITKLNASNIYTVYDFMFLTCDDLMNKTELSFKEIESIRETFYKNYGGEQINSLDLYNNEVEEIIATGIKSLDSLLEGGLHCGQMYEICGTSSAGKSQLCHSISMNATLNAATQVHYIDASSNFCVSRIQMILESNQCSDRSTAIVMSGIKLYKVTSIVEVFSILYQLSKMPTNQSKKSKKIIIVDSLAVLSYVIEKTEFNTALTNFASVCRYFINHFRAVVIIVNTVRFEHGAKTAFDTDKTLDDSLRPQLTNYWLSVPNVRLLITSLENNRREIAVWKSCHLENGKKCFVHIKDEGII